MEELFKKISSYNLLNNLLPGVALLGAFHESSLSKFALQNTFLGLAICYLIGVLVGRIGSIIVEKPLKCIAPHQPYGDFIDAVKVDPKIEILSETNNTYRSLLSASFCYGIIIIFQKINSIWWNWSTNSFSFKLTVSLGILLLLTFSYKKQTEYISTRVKKLTKQHDS